MEGTRHWRITLAPLSPIYFISTPLPGSPNSFIFMQFLAKIDKVISFWELAPPLGENPGSATASTGRARLIRTRLIRSST